MDGTCYGAVNTRMKVGFLFRLVSLDVERTGHRPAIALFFAIPELTGEILSNVKNEAKCDVE